MWPFYWRGTPATGFHRKEEQHDKRLHSALAPPSRAVFSGCGTGKPLWLPGKLPPRGAPQLKGRSSPGRMAPSPLPTSPAGPSPWKNSPRPSPWPTTWSTSCWWAGPRAWIRSALWPLTDGRTPGTGNTPSLPSPSPSFWNWPSVGGYHNDVLDAEKVLALAPDVLLINTSQYTENEASIPTWEAAGIQVVTVDYHKMSLENHLAQHPDPGCAAGPSRGGGGAVPAAIKAA